MPYGHCFEPHIPGVDTDILKGGAGNNHVQSTCENFRACPLFTTTPTNWPRWSTNDSSLQHFWCIFVITFMTGPSLRGLHWLGRGGLGFILYACISALRGATAPLALPLYPPLCSPYSIQQARQSCMQILGIF